MARTSSWTLSVQISTTDLPILDRIGYSWLRGYTAETRLPGKAPQYTLSGETSSDNPDCVTQLQELISSLRTILNLSLGGSADAALTFGEYLPTARRSGNTFSRATGSWQEAYPLPPAVPATELAVSGPLYPH